MPDANVRHVCPLSNDRLSWLNLCRCSASSFRSERLLHRAQKSQGRFAFHTQLGFRLVVRKKI